MALSRSLATIAAVVFCIVAEPAPAQHAEQPTIATLSSLSVLERLAKEANELKEASQWDAFRAKLKEAEIHHKRGSTILDARRKELDYAQRQLDLELGKIERPQIMIQAILAEVHDLDDEVLKAACQRVNAEGIRPIESGKPGHLPVIYSLSSDQTGRLLAVIEKRRPTQIVSRPSILTIDGQVAEIMVGQKVKRARVTRNEQGNTKFESIDEDVGLVVSLTPSIEDDRQIRIALVVENSALTGRLLGIGAQPDGKVITSPVIDREKMETAFKSGDSRTILVAIRSKKPADESEPTKTTLLLLTPRIVDRTAAAGEILHH